MIVANKIKNAYLRFVDVLNGNNHNFATFENIKERDNLYFYAGDLEYHNRTSPLERFNKTTFVLKEIDYQKGCISRTPDNDERVMNPRRPLSIVLDAYK